jgi:hypothetical protein
MACATPLGHLSAQDHVQTPARTVLVTSVLRPNVLSDSLGQFLRQELAMRYGVALVSGDATSPQQKTDSLGRRWTIERLRDFASARRADALIDVSVAAIGTSDSLQVRVVKGTAPFLIIDSFLRSSDQSIASLAQAVAREVTRSGWPANER